MELGEVAVVLVVVIMVVFRVDKEHRVKEIMVALHLIETLLVVVQVVVVVEPVAVVSMQEETVYRMILEQVLVYFILVVVRGQLVRLVQAEVRAVQAVEVVHQMDLMV